MSESQFLFIQVQQTGKVPPRRDVRTAIQKHVMRDIGAARRGRPRPQRRPENFGDFKNHETHLLRCVVSRTYRNNSLLLEQQDQAGRSVHELVPTEPSKKVPSLISGGCRTDPFACFPVHMTADTSFLIDYCGYIDYFLYMCSLSNISCSIRLIRTPTSTNQRNMAATKSLRSCTVL